MTQVYVLYVMLRTDGRNELVFPTLRDLIEALRSSIGQGYREHYVRLEDRPEQPTVEPVSVP